MSGPRQRLALSVSRREAPGWLIFMSLALHLAVFLALLAKPPIAPVPASEPMPVEFVMEAGPAEAAAQTDSTSAAAIPGTPVQQAEVPPAATADTPSPPVQPSEASVAEPERAPDVPPPPVQPIEAPAPTPAPVPNVLPADQAELALPTPTQKPPPPAPRQAIIPPPSPPVPPTVLPRPLPPAPAPQPRPARPPPPRMVARPAAPRASSSPAEAAANPTDGQSAPSRASLASNGVAWMGRLKQWWDQNSFYPREASQTNEGGSVRVRIAIDGDGQVTAISVVQGSGSSVLDAAAVAVFRGARLPPLPAGAPPQPADVVITLHYRPGGE